MTRKIIVRNLITREVEFESDWICEAEFDEIWRVFSKPCFFGNKAVYEKEIEFRREYSVNFTDMFDNKSKRIFDTANAAIAHANERFMSKKFFKSVYVMDDSTGEFIFTMYRDPCYYTGT